MRLKHFLILAIFLFLILTFSLLFFSNNAKSDLKPFADHLKRNGEFTLCRPFRDGNGPGYIFTYSKNHEGKIIQRPVLHSEHAYESLDLKKMTAIMPSFEGKVELDSNLTSSILSGFSTDTIKLKQTLKKITKTFMEIGDLEVWQGDEVQLSKQKLSSQASKVLRRYKNKGLLDGIFIVYEAIKTKKLSFSFQTAIDTQSEFNLPQIVKGLSIDPSIKFRVDGNTLVFISPANVPKGAFIGYKDSSIIDFIEETDLTPSPALELIKTTFKKRSDLLK